MASPGQELREAREARRISIEEIASATKIVPRYLEALEADHLEKMPGKFFIKGIIRTYAKAIGLDAEDVLNKYRAAGLIEETEAKTHAPSRPAQPPPMPAVSPAAAPPAPAPPPRALDEPEAVPAPREEPPPSEGLIATSVPEPPEPGLLTRLLRPPLRGRTLLWATGFGALALAFVFLVLPRLSRGPARTEAAAAKTTAEVTPAVLPPPAKSEPLMEPPAEVVWQGVTIEISFRAETWIQVYADGELKVDGLFPPGATAKAQANERLLIHVGNAGGFTFTLNGKPAKPLGRSGQVITDIKITPDNIEDFLESEADGGPVG